MPAEITMPQQSDTMTEGTLVKWMKNEGDTIAEGDVVAEIETDKATMEMEGPDQPGTLAAVLVKEGDQVPVGTVLAVVALDGEDVAEVKKSAGSGKSGGAAAASKQAAEGGDDASATATATATKPAANIESSNGQTRTNADNDYGGPNKVTMDMPASNGSGNGSGNGNGTGGRVFASPLAKRIAKNEGVDIAQISGTGPGGRIVQKDVLAFIDGGGAKQDAPAQQSQPAAASLPQRVASGQTETEQLSKMRQAIAKQLQKSMQTLPHFYETMDIRMDAAEALRASLNKQMEKEGVRLSIGDLIAKAVAATLKLHPVLNSTFDGETVTRHGDVHLGMAVALDNGLIVPVLRNIDQMGLREIRLRSKDIIDKARAQKLKGDEMTGATFTVSNLGAFGIKQFTAIINPPAVAILAIGAGKKQPIVTDDGDLEVGTIMNVTLSADHRVVDGADSARFLQTLKSMLEEPGMMLM